MGEFVVNRHVRVGGKPRMMRTHRFRYARIVFIPPARIGWKLAENTSHDVFSTQEEFPTCVDFSPCGEIFWSLGKRTCRCSPAGTRREEFRRAQNFRICVEFRRASTGDSLLNRVKQFACFIGQKQPPRRGSELSANRPRNRFYCERVSAKGLKT